MVEANLAVEDAMVAKVMVEEALSRAWFAWKVDIMFLFIIMDSNSIILLIFLACIPICKSIQGTYS